ncbi:MAG: DUF4956 domain-containing protein [Bavariicoccus seileri]|uniref:DUF4956 domain-containing protein n=1 Tax=Bavariicoccus seileri TaxID=549685 RepID=UPI003F99932F
MTNLLFNNIIDDTSATLTLADFLICSISAILLGMILVFGYKNSGNTKKDFMVVLAILPFVVQMVIMLVNGNLGTGVAVMGAFSLIRFRSAPGTAREIGAIFISMAIGLAVGTGYIGLSWLFTILVCIIWAVYQKTAWLNGDEELVLQITIP